MTDVLMFPKPVKRKSVKAKLKKQNAKWIKGVRAEVFERDGSRCRSCLYRREHGGERYPWWRMEDQYRLEMHEIVFRSKTGGQPIEQRINTENCVVLCSGCHRALHDSKISIEMEDESAGADSALVFTARTDLW